MSLDIFAKFATDESLENNGTWRELGGDAKLLVARTGNTQYAKLLSKEYERNRQALDLGDDASEKLSNAIMADVMAETILLGWENVAYKGELIEYTKANAKMLLSHKDFRRAVAAMADDMESYLMKVEDDQGKA